MRTERKRLIIFILFLAALAAALFLLFAPSAQFAAAEEQGETTEPGSGETGGEGSGETGGDEPAPPSAQNVASVTLGGGTVQYPDFSSALAAWTEG